MTEDPLHPIKEKLDEMHKDMKGAFKTLHDRADREANDRIGMMDRIWMALGSLRQDIASLFRRSPP